MSNDDDNVIELPQREGQQAEPEANPYADRLQPTISIRAEGTTFSEIIDNARKRAAKVLQAPENHLYVVNHSIMTVLSSTRFEDPARPVVWTMNVTFAPVPEDEPEPPPEPKRRSAPRKKPTARKPKS